MSKERDITEGGPVPNENGKEGRHETAPTFGTPSEQEQDLAGDTCTAPATRSDNHQGARDEDKIEEQVAARITDETQKSAAPAGGRRTSSLSNSTSTSTAGSIAAKLSQHNSENETQGETVSHKSAEPNLLAQKAPSAEDTSNQDNTSRDFAQVLLQPTGREKRRSNYTAEKGTNIRVTSENAVSSAGGDDSENELQGETIRRESAEPNSLAQKAPSAEDTINQDNQSRELAQVLLQPTGREKRRSNNTAEKGTNIRVTSESTTGGDRPTSIDVDSLIFSSQEDDNVRRASSRSEPDSLARGPIDVMVSTVDKGGNVLAAAIDVRQSAKEATTNSVSFVRPEPESTSNNMLAAHLQRRRTSKDSKGSKDSFTSSMGRTSVSTLATASTLGSSTATSGSIAGLTPINRQEWQEKRISLENSQAVAINPSVLVSESNSKAQHPQRVLMDPLIANPSSVKSSGLTNSTATTNTNTTNSIGPPAPAGDHSQQNQYQLQQLQPQLVVARLVSDVDASSSPSESEQAPPQRQPQEQQQHASPEAEEDPNLVTVQAEPEKLEDTITDILKSRKGRCCLLGIVMVVVIIAGSLAAGISRSRSDDFLPGVDETVGSDENQQSSTVNPSSYDSLATTGSPTSLPTIPPVSMQPSQAPSVSSAPSTEFLGYLVGNRLLPNYTLSALQDVSSPQFRALEWLEYGHPAGTLANMTERLIQRFALATLFYSTNGDLWRKRARWLSPDVHECDWWSYVEEVGVLPQPICNNNGDYIALLLSKNFLKGTLPPELSLLTSLEEIRFESDSFRPSEDKKDLYLIGSIPTEYGLLSKLQILDINKNALSGTIPTELGLLSSSMTSIYLLENYMVGNLPSELGLLTSLEKLFLYDNAFTGTLPSQLGQLSGSLATFSAYQNALTGSIPTEFGLLTKLVTLLLQGNGLSSLIPSHIGALDSLKWLSVSRNQLTGMIPTELGNLRSLWQLYVSFNRLTGTIPRSLGNPPIRWGHFNNNMLSGQIPSELGRLTFSFNIRLGNNRFSGSVPEEICALEAAGQLLFSVSVDCQKVECDCRCCSNCRCRDQNVSALSLGVNGDDVSFEFSNNP